MGDNVPEGDGGERNEGLEIKSRPPESHSESKANHMEGDTMEKQIIYRKIKTPDDTSSPLYLAPR